MNGRVQIKPVTVALLVVGLILVVVAIVYFVTPAHSLPGFFPGRQAGLQRHHVTHGIAALVVGLVAWAGAWFTTSPSSAT